MLHTIGHPVFERATRALASAAPSRRGFLKAIGGAGAGLAVGLVLPGLKAGPAAAAAGDGVFNPFVTIGTDGAVTVVVKHLDKGQGIATGLATLVAEELDADPAQIRTTFAPADVTRYANLDFGMQGTGGSTSIHNSFEQYRKAGAAARAMLVEAAAKAWGVPAAEVTVAAGRIGHASGRSAGFGDFADAAAALPAAAEPKLKSPEQWTLIGKSFPRVDVPNKSHGAPDTYGMDVHMDGMLVVTVIRAPKWGATVKSFDAAAALKVRGVVDVKSGPFGVAVFADKTFPAIKARDLVTVEWDFSKAETRGTDAILADYRKLLDQPGAVARTGDAEAGLKGAAKVVEAEYVFPYLAHAPMEPLDVTVLVDKDKATFWTGSQMPTVDQGTAAAILGLKPEQVEIVTLWAGGSFGRRAILDAHYVAEAALIAKAFGEPRPIKVVWTREDDIRGGYYRPMYVHRVRAGVDAAGKIVGWHHRIVGQSIFTGTMMEQYVVKDGVDATSIEGTADTTYAIPAMQVELHSPKVGVPVLWWRSVGNTHTAYVMETMVDALAAAAGKDPLEFRLALIQDDPRKVAVLKLAAEKAGWTTPAAEGRHRGIAVHKSFNTYVAEVAEVTMDGSTVKVEKVVCAVDCGVAVNPDNIRAQMEGGIGFGLGAVLRDGITLTDGTVDQGNFDGYEPIRMSDMPAIEVHIVASAEAPTGVGEPGVPPIGPAVANAVFKATGRHPRNLPFSNADFV
ncbi:xanthine dehydrogenase family protein molybdopterin-binding subunit [Oharaeibacter diazotrophicus]|uniref:Isoquinoline 1-oxidoreductase beta subunit n=1 Tax=Oharaeibacter diazotrophicus TaxID=1920512 RepID=A0A4R6RFH5_9HYPH|nr:xanthine dehydrogenase family protein molybdopterin-binding subunit [Oharaeibacter diazotrophicus]TDP84982.1 isoquinoline 1-oxidoreductase beta subunit [Oharaeibacter diazotrophicus]BBE73951.1 aldehyde dehydrogenase [Pleomorphomonas sp. SM30]GLS76362.1 oxidoreductase [Oharaeibacter diazotrophicus]